jgi:hypothetical protein
LLLANKRPNLIALHESTAQVSHTAIHEIGATIASSQQEGCDGIPVNIGHTVDRAEGIAFNQGRDYS